MRKKNVKIIAPIAAAVLGATVAFAGCEGPMGPAGPAGEPGRNGQDGTNGTNGTNGKDGQDGTNGTNGQDGAPGQPFESEFSKTMRWIAEPERRASTWGLPEVELQGATIIHFINETIIHFDNDNNATRQSAVENYENITGTLITKEIQNSKIRGV